jgi:hypothetical protein
MVSAEVLTLREVRERWIFVVERAVLRLSDSELSEPKRHEATADTGRRRGKWAVERKKVEPSLAGGRSRNALSGNDLLARLSAIVVESVLVGTMLKCNCGRFSKRAEPHRAFQKRRKAGQGSIVKVKASSVLYICIVFSF